MTNSKTAKSTTSSASELPEFYVKGSKYKKTTKDQDYDLIRRYRKGDKAAGDELVRNNLRMVMSLAHKFAGFGHFDDLVSEGNIGLIIALEKYNPKFKVKFATYASNWVMAQLRTYSKKQRSVVKQNVNKPCLEDSSLNEPVPYIDTDEEKIDQLESDLIDQESAMLKEELNNMVRDAGKIAGKTKYEKDIILKRLYTDEPQTLKEIGDAGGISRERVRQIELQVKSKLKRILSERACDYINELGDVA